ncbi:hypothetical protein NP233_g12200 [Leucocoprinus birnbaumii]|uniref:Uncharacterized protein n=1 Tax=Leucocoprinus birnbaumii TaxID=56174 RepID=A0AAD5VIT6_9AGAR|nr:hypothetical protein NP233_g12200 [Leucocoprinus birnbaumii]
MQTSLPTTPISPSHPPSSPRNPNPRRPSHKSHRTTNTTQSGSAQIASPTATRSIKSSLGDQRLPREYLVKWQDRSYRRLSWVPHMWLVSTNGSKLKNFLSGGTKVELLNEPVKDDDGKQKDKDVGKEVEFEVGAEERAGDGAVPSRASSVKPADVRDALPDAERYIPTAWKTVDRVLDIVLWTPKKEKRKEKEKKGKKKGTRKQIVTTEEEEDEGDEDVQELEEFKRSIFEEGEFMVSDDTETAEQWEARTGEVISMKLMKRVVWAFIKWDDLGYDETSWDSPPQPGEKGYDAFKSAFERFVFSRSVEIPKLSTAHWKQFDDRAKGEYRKKYALKDAADLQLGQAPGLKLMDFQVEGFNWLCDNWWNHQQCILADEMGLGKTVQVTTFLGFINKNFKAMPALVVVPNSTITNWVREFERWAPNLRVVPFYGEKKARDVIKLYELFHKNHLSTNTPAKFHVLVTTYENITGRDFTTVFKNQDRWEVLVVDEGQRLKSDSSLLFRKLNELRSNHRIIMTGTPLNNNIRELFNLMNFLDPKEWFDLEGLAKEYDNLTEEGVKVLHNRLRPYFLRRIKSEVLKLPAKNEVIVPVSMTPLQKEVFQSIYTHNLNILNGLTQKSLGNIKGKLNNVLMHMRKCLQHPYLYSPDIEPKGLSREEAHEKLIHGSAKLRLLKSLLPQLKARGHRVLLFSQDGNTKGAERQKGMDEFNKPGSEVFIYLLTTRAGGVGINLFSADTVIIFDPDFNPHQDLQAIARAYRYGQKKTCLVFKLMVKDSPEDRIMQIGKKKLILDHVIVQKMDQDDDEAGQDIQSIMTYGAQKLFDDSDSARDITYSDQDILKLIEKTEVEGEEEDRPKEGQAFSFAKVWAADRDSLEEIEDNDQADSWATALKQIELERAKDVAKAEADSGRGRRKAAAVAKRKMGANDLPDGEQTAKKQKKSKKVHRSDASGSAYTGTDGGESIEDSSDAVMHELMLDDDEIPLPPHLPHRVSPVQDVAPPPLPPAPKPKPKKQKRHPKPHKYPTPTPEPECGLCGHRHGEGKCYMTHSSENLRDFREILILHTDDEPWEVRSAAIRVIDEVLYQRGQLSLIAGQPLHPMKPQPTNPNPAPSKPTLVNSSAPVRPPVQQQITQPQPQQAPRQFLAPPQPQMPIASSSTFPPLPTTGSTSSQVSMPPVTQPKKKKVGYGNGDIKCPVCETSPTHLVKDCPAVRAGSKSISQQIERLESAGGKSDVVDILRKLLKKQKNGKRTACPLTSSTHAAREAAQRHHTPSTTLLSMQHAYGTGPLGTQHYSSTTSLKRARSNGEISGIPRLPEINTDLVLEVYTHESLCPSSDAKPEEFLDNRRLAKLGEVVLDTAVTLVLFRKQGPKLLTGEEINEQLQRIVNDDVIQGWVKSYQMASRILCKAEFKSKREDPEECRKVFCAYVGAVFRQSGQDVVGKWIELLIKYHEQQQTTSSSSATPTMGGATGSEIPPAKKIKNEPNSSSLNPFAALSPTLSSISGSSSTTTTTGTSNSSSSQSHSSQAYSPTAPYLNAPQSYASAYAARQVPPHMSVNKSSASPYGGSPAPSSISSSSAGQMGNLNALFQSLTRLSQSPHVRAVTAKNQTPSHMGLGTTTSRPNPLAPATPYAPFLPMFNQSAAQRGVKVDYNAEFEGPAHAGQWLVECLVNGIPKGKGKGSSKQIAKEEAAREAYYAMGWT